MDLFKEHAVAPFFVFQIFCVGLWCLDEYWYYSLFTLFMLIVFEATVVFQRLRTIGEFRAMNQKPFTVYVKREKKWIQIESDELLPGDVVSMTRTKEDQGVPCDLVISDGSCIVNEAMLSGESTPLLKESVALRDPNDSFDLVNVDKLNVLYGGTKVLQVTPPENDAAPDGGCICTVARTGFGTSQGNLVRTMIFSTERVTANNFEALLFILFLCVFAIAASAYVWEEGVKNDRKRSKLLLDCILIITSVVPPELPMELSMAVNTSLVALAKYAIYCTEPFRIPFAGKVDVCCFDKTGTLTGEDLVFEGVAYADPDQPHTELIKATEVPKTTKWVLASAHALVQLEDGIVGDPMEKETLKAVDWDLGAREIVAPKESKKKQNLQIRRRFQFSSALKRQSSISILVHPDFGKHKTFAAVKGAPETLKTMYTHVPNDYDEAYRYYTRKGSRVLALGYKFLEDGLSTDQINNLSRDNVESELTFAGFIVFSCPLKEDAIEALKELNESSHRCIMITGDNPLTACAVAREVAIVEREVLIVDKLQEKTVFHSVDESIRFEVDPNAPLDQKMLDKYDLCITGSAMNDFMDKPNMKILLEHTWVYARVSPSQKEYLLMGLKDLGYTTLMAGDGTNDVGALKQAHIGVALLDGTPEDLKKIAERAKIDRLKNMYEQQKKLAERFNSPPPPPPPAIAHLYPEHAQRVQQLQQQQANMTPQQRRQMEQKAKVENMATKFMEDMDMEEPPTIKFGDASVAAPFTSKLRNVMAVNNIIRQGRCTLVATIQMYKILALNCLISAYSLSVLYLDGIKFGDLQVTISGMLMAVCFLCISRGKPIQKLSKERPQSNIFNPYIILSVLGQFAVHITALIYVNSLANYYEPPKEVDLEGEFEPSLLNSGVYLIQLSMQVSTFAINYQGHPFRERIQDNKALYYGLMSVGGIALAGATELFPEVNEQLKLVAFPSAFRDKLTFCMILDYGVSYLIEVVTKSLFADNRAKSIAQRGRKN
ncbi:ATPase [Circinella umbellata]|nr:ATPase [Circinella umbellata]